MAFASKIALIGEEIDDDCKIIVPRLTTLLSPAAPHGGLPSIAAQYPASAGGFTEAAREDPPPTRGERQWEEPVSVRGWRITAKAPASCPQRSPSFGRRESLVRSMSASQSFLAFGNDLHISEERSALPNVGRCCARQAVLLSRQWIGSRS
jgi:hypothetical protein